MPMPCETASQGASGSSCGRGRGTGRSARPAAGTVRPCARPSRADGADVPAHAGVAQCSGWRRSASTAGPTPARPQAGSARVRAQVEVIAKAWSTRSSMVQPASGPVAQAAAGRPVTWSRIANRMVISARYPGAVIRWRRGRKWGEMPLNADRNRWAAPVLQKPFIARSRCLVGWWLFSARLFRPLWERCLHRGHGLAVGGAVGAELVRDDYPRHRARRIEEPAEQAPGRGLVPAVLHEDVQHHAVLIDGPATGTSAHR